MEQRGRFEQPPLLRDCNEITWLFYGKINKLLYELNSFISNHKITN
jgi:hypothetical protein